jgi:UDP-N-acetylglucosamine:LPS N-acetylglucosamine transferase
VDYVVRAGAGIWAPTPGRVAAAVDDLLSPGNPRLVQMATRARALAQSKAAQRAAEIAWAAASGELA